MISVAAIRMQQFGVQFYQASLTASDIDKLVRFEVLSYGQQAEPPVRGGKRRGTPSKVNWDFLERRILDRFRVFREITKRAVEIATLSYLQRDAADGPTESHLLPCSGASG